MTITQTLPNFPLINQLNEGTSDGASDNNARLNCVVASLAAGLEFLTGRHFDGDMLKDAVYGPNYQGGMAASHFVAYCAKLGIRLWPVNASQSGLVAELHSAIAAGHPALVTMPSQWGTAPANPVNPSGWTHVGIACGEGPGEIRVMNPWGSFFQDQPDAWWQARLCYGQVWPMQKVGAAMATIPSGWKDDGKLLTAPNGKQCDLGFRDFVLNFPGGWPAWNWPLENESGVNPVEMGNPSLGGGTHQPFRATLLEWTAAKGVFVAWVGDEYVALRTALAKADGQVSSLTAQVAALQAQLAAAGQTPAPALTPAQEADIAAIAALKSALG